MKHLFIIPFQLLVFCHCLLAQTIRNIQVFGAGTNEVSVAISPKDTNVVVMGANISYDGYSSDGGLTWQTVDLHSTYGVWGDPCILTDTAGDFYFFHLADNDTITVWPKWCDRIVCQKSINEGAGWNGGTFAGLDLPKMEDKEWAALDPETNYIAICWTQFDEYKGTAAADSSRVMFSISKDEGQTWAPPKVLSTREGDCMDETNTTQGPIPAFGLNGEIYVAWALRDSLYFIKSIDTGNTWMSREVVIGAQPGGSYFGVPGVYRTYGLPELLVDHSNSPFRGQLYLSWSDTRNGPADADVFLMKSWNGGSTWSAPIRVNDDPPGKENFMPWMAIDQANGELYSVFYDRRNHDDDSTDVYLAWSANGGENFTNMKISETPFFPDSAIFLGDYIGIGAYNGCVRPAWTRIDGTTSTVWEALISHSDVVNNLIPLQQSGFKLMSANPSSGQCIIHADLPQAFSVSITDLSGNEVYERQGNQSFFMGDLNALGLECGLYLVSCKSELQQHTFKIIYFNR